MLVLFAMFAKMHCQALWGDRLPSTDAVPVAGDVSPLFTRSYTPEYAINVEHHAYSKHRVVKALR